VSKEGDKGTWNTIKSNDGMIHLPKKERLFVGGCCQKRGTTADWKGKKGTAAAERRRGHAAWYHRELKREAGAYSKGHSYFHRLSRRYE